MLSELVTALISWQVSSSPGYLFCDKLFLQSNPTLAAVQSCLFSQADEGYICPLSQNHRSLFHAHITFIMGIYIIILMHFL